MSASAAVPAFTDRRAVAAAQLELLRRLLAELVPGNRFYSERLAAAGLSSEIDDLRDFTARMPLTSKAEIVDDQARHPPYGSNLTYPLEQYVRFHQTSGTTGSPLRWLDTRDSWQWMLDNWCQVFTVAGIGAGDRVFFPFSFGPFLGFWTAFDAVQRLGCLAIPGGGMTSKDRLRVIFDNRVTALCSTPTYAIRLAEVAAADGWSMAESSVRALFVAGEPGGSIAATRQRLAQLWGGAKIWDHHGMTEVGPVSFQNPEVPEVLHIIEPAYLAEVIDPVSGAQVAPGEVGELVLTTLGRLGSPLLRYRTGDLVRLSAREPVALGWPQTALEGGILARADDMVVVRGINLYPGGVEQVIRSLPGVGEYRVLLDPSSPLTEVRVEIEAADASIDGANIARRLEEALRQAFLLRLPVTLVERGSLPRFELKAKRWIKLS